MKHMLCKKLVPGILIVSMLLTALYPTSVNALAKPVVSAQKRTKTTVMLTFKKIKGADSYIIYRSKTKSGKYKKIATTSSGKYKVKNLKANSRYYFKVAAVKKKTGKVVSKRYSKPVKVAKYKTSGGQNKSSQSIQQPTTQVSSSPTTQAPVSQNSPAKDVLSLVNQERVANGLSPLELDNTLTKAANARAKELSDKFSHTRPNGSSWSTILKEYNISYRYTGENIAVGQSSAKAVMNSWMNSSGHRANILNTNYQKIGIGYYQLPGSNYTYHWVQIFTN